MKIEFRDTNEVDLPLLSKWITMDSCPQHNGVDPSFWLPETDDADVKSKCITVMCDGAPVFFIKLENVMRAYIQFAPEAERDKLATSLGLKKAFLTVAGGAKKIGYREMIFESRSSSLVDFFKRFSFKEVVNNFLVRL